MTKHIGIVAGSSEGAALCYRTICLEAPAVMGEHNHPEITMNSVPMAVHMRHIVRNDWEAAAELLLASAHKVAQAGADFAVIHPESCVLGGTEVGARFHRRQGDGETAQGDGKRPKGGSGKSLAHDRPRASVGGRVAHCNVRRTRISPWPWSSPSMALPSSVPGRCRATPPTLTGCERMA